MQKTPSKVEYFTKIALIRPSLSNISKITRFIWVFMLPWIYNFDIESIQSRPFLPSVKQGNSFQVISWHLQSSCSRYFFPKTIWQSNIGNAEDNMTVHFSLLLQAQHGARARLPSIQRQRKGVEEYKVQIFCENLSIFWRLTIKPHFYEVKLKISCF